MKHSLGISNFLEEFSSLLFCCSLFFCTYHWGMLSYLSLLFFGTLHSNGYIFPFLLCLSLLFTAIWKATSATIVPFCVSFPRCWSWSLPPVQCQEPPTIVLQALSLSGLIAWIYFSLPLYNHKGFDLGHTWMVYILHSLHSTFPTFFNLSMNLAISSSWSVPQSGPSLAFANCIEFLHLWMQRI